MAAAGPVIRVRILKTRGSTPREEGCEMRVGARDIEGTIGGGALEWEAMRIAREMLKNGAAEREVVVPLGPSLGQCCGGSVVLGFAQAEAGAPPKTRPLVIWGGGHVGRAVAQVMAGQNGLETCVVDTIAQRTSAMLPTNVDEVVVEDPVLLARSLPAAGHHLILTYSHSLDLRLCDALLRCDTLSIGLIGSATKWARFQTRLGALGHSAAEISRIQCPIGDPSLGKHPAAIAVGVAAALLRVKAGTSLGDSQVQRHEKGGAAG